MKYAIFTTLLLFAQAISAQDLHIYYDVQHDTIMSYQMNGKITTKPKAKMNHHIVLHLENINDYLFRAEVAVDEKDIDIPEGSGLESLLNPSNNIPDIFLQSSRMNLPLQQLKTIANTPNDTKKTMGHRETNKAKDNNDAALISRFTKLTSELAAIETSLKEIITQVDQTIVSGKTRIFAINEVNNLKLRPDLPPKIIKKLALEYLESSLDVSSPKELNVTNLISKFNSRDKITTQIELLKSIKNNYLSKSKEIQRFPNQFNSVGVSAQLETTFLQEIAKVLTTTELVKIKTRNYLKYVDEISPEIIRAEQIDNLLKLRNEYEAISNRSFSKIIRIPANKDISDITISFTPKDTSIAGISKETVTMSPIRVNVAGGIKVNVSGGISFGKFKNGPISYYVRDSIIHADEPDDYTPFLTSFLHFYWQSARNTSLGLSLGAGIPIGTEQRIKTPVFFIGPSILLGKTNRMVITIGAMSAKVSTLGEGYSDNDTFIINESAQLPIVDKYQMGAFLGISYNIR